MCSLYFSSCVLFMVSLTSFFRGFYLSPCSGSCNFLISLLFVLSSMIVLVCAFVVFSFVLVLSRQFLSVFFFIGRDHRDAIRYFTNEGVFSGSNPFGLCPHVV